MNGVNKDVARRKAALAALLLLLTGALLGVLVDRLWLLPRDAEAMPLTADAMAARLDLAPEEEARIRALLESLHAEVMDAARHGPDSLWAMSATVHRRLEEALPPAARAEFRAWIREHHRQMHERMGGPPMHGPGGPGMHGHP